MQDYPSLAQLHEKLRDSNILPIFAVTELVSDLYQSLSTMWSDVGAVAGKLDDNSGNVVSLIASKYEVWYLINFQLLFNLINAA